MTGNLKQRVVGIVVLVFLALIIFPWLFGNNQRVVFDEKNKHEKAKVVENDLPEMIKEPAQTIKPIPDKIEQQSSPFMEEKKSDLNTAPKQPPLSEQEPSVNKPDKTLKRVTQIYASKINNIENAIVHNNDVNQDIKKITTAKSDDVELNAPNLAKIKLVPKALSKKSMVNSSEKNWTIQLGSFNSKANATKLVQKLKAKHYPAYTQTSKSASGVTITKVFVGPQSDRHSAQTLVSKIDKSLKVHGVIVKMSL